MKLLRKRLWRHVDAPIVLVVFTSTAFLLAMIGIYGGKSSVTQSCGSDPPDGFLV